MTKMAAFTLVEMSIVLIIIGLIVAGIAKGQDMIRAAKISSLVSEKSNLEVAIRTFDDKYDYLPGDLPNASDYWGSATVNGNGDRKICCASSPYETFYIWNHLSLAKMIDGAYGTTTSNNPVVNTHIPQALTGDDTGWWAFHSGNDGHGWNFNANPIYGKRGNVIAVGSERGDDYIDGGVLTAAEARSVDVKIEDGIVNTGKVFVIKGIQSGGGYETGCVNQNPTVGASTAVTFTLTDQTKSCKPVFFLDY